MAENIPIQSLAFADIKSAFIAYLQGDQAYKDFKFDAAGISQLLNILAYSGHQIGYYTKMLTDESYIDSARLRAAMLALAKNTGYTPGSRASAKVDLTMKIKITTGQDPVSATILIPKGTSFSGTNTTADTRLYQVIDDVLCTIRDTSVTGFITYTSPEFTAYEGSYESWNFLVNTSIFNQRFVIRDPNIDISTIRVNVLDHTGSSNSTPFNLADDVFVLDATSNAFFITTQEDGYYQIFFGNGVFGKALQNGNVIAVTYVSTNGPSGNGAKSFLYNAPPADPSTDYNVGNFSNFTVIATAPSNGGLEPETVDSMRFTIPNSWRAQNRIVTEEDYQTILLSKFRNIESISVWGGEENITKEYGKVFVSIKPLFSDQLTSSAQASIRSAIADKYGIVGGDIQFVNPDYINVAMTVYAKIDLRQTNRSLGEIEALLLSRSNTYNTEQLSKFGNMLSDVGYLDTLKDGEDEIVSIYTTKTLGKGVQILYGTTSQIQVVYGNQLVPDIKSSTFNYGGAVCTYRDDLDGKVYIWNETTNTKFVATAQGSVDLVKGIIYFTFPTTATITGSETDTQGVLTWTATPKVPDISTYLNNIVRIAATEVILQ